MAAVAPTEGRLLVQLGEGLLDAVQALTNIEETQFSRTVAVSNEQVRKLQATLATTSTKLLYVHNAVQPINRLPTSVLARVFIILKDLPSKQEDAPFSPPSLHWIPSTNTCIYWRAVALATPPLWSLIVLNGKAGVAQISAFVSRSEDEPLTVLGRPPQSGQSIAQIHNYRRGLRYIISNAPHRVEKVMMELGFPIDDVDRADILGQKLATDLSKTLPNLGLTTHRLGGSRSGPPDGPLSTLFSDAIAGVKVLELYSLAITHFMRSSKPFQHLTVLQLVHVKEFEEFPLTQDPKEDTFRLSKLLRTLTASRQTLRKVTLVGIPFWDDLDSSSYDGRPIELQSLESVEIGDWPLGVEMSKVLDHLRIPPSAARYVWGTSLCDPTSNFLPAFLDFCLRPQNRLDGDDTPLPISRLLLSSVPGGDMVAYQGETLHINGSIPFYVYSPLLSTFSDTIKEIVVTPVREPLTLENWRVFFTLLPMLQTIKVRDVEASLLLYALRSSGTASEEIALRHLEEIDIQYSYTDCTTRTDPSGVEFSTEPYTLVVTLFFVARERAEAGLKLARTHVRLHDRVETSLWEDLDMAFKDLGQWTRLTYSKRPESIYSLPKALMKERLKEERDRWYLVKKEFSVNWPTQAVYFARSLGSSG